MMNLDGALEPMLKELRNTFSSIKGSKSLEESITIEYIVEVDTEKEKEGIEKVGMTLSSQARRFGFCIEVIPVTTKELSDAKEAYENFSASEATLNGDVNEKE